MKPIFVFTLLAAGIPYAVDAYAEDNKAEELLKAITPTIQEQAKKVMPETPAATFPCCAVCADVHIPLDGSIKKCVVPPGDECNMC